MKIDVFTHVQPRKFKEILYKYSDRFMADKSVQEKRPALTDHKLRVQSID